MVEIRYLMKIIVRFINLKMQQQSPQEDERNWFFVFSDWVSNPILLICLDLMISYQSYSAILDNKFILLLKSMIWTIFLLHYSDSVATKTSKFYYFCFAIQLFSTGYCFYIVWEFVQSLLNEDYEFEDSASKFTLTFSVQLISSLLSRISKKLDIHQRSRSNDSQVQQEEEQVNMTDMHLD